MRRPDVRFRPPRLAVTAEVRWMLLRAFGPVPAPAGLAPAGIDPAAALAVARRFEVSARIAARHGRERLAAELGPEAAAGFTRDRAAAAAVGLRLAEVASELSALAAPLGIPLVFLKLMALQLSGRIASGSRSACDLDVLVPGDRAAALADALRARGFRSAEVHPEEHQLPALAHPAGGVVEIHVLVPGVRLGPGRASATAEEIARRGLLRPLADLPGDCSVPVPEILAAHALVHGLAQHGGAPGAYSLLKALGDSIDLGLAVGPDGAHPAEGGDRDRVARAGTAPPHRGNGQEGGESLARRIAPWISRDLSSAEIEAARVLCVALCRGEDPDPESPAGLLLRHALAGRLDPRYARSLKLSLFRAQPSELPAAGRLARAVWRAVFLSRGQVDALYGRPAGRLGYLGRRLWRPFDLAGRLGRYAASSLAPRIGQESGEGAPRR